jgi:phosphate transport system permease protein
MQTIGKKFFSTTKSRPVGEPFVWFSAMGLTLGLFMIAFLLGIIFINGTKVFWPQEVKMIQLKKESTYKIKDSTLIAGVQAHKQEIKGQVTGRENKKHVFNKEVQFFVANKDLYGFSFKYVPEDQIVSIEKPYNIMRIERLEYGDALGMPLLLKLNSGNQLVASDTAFNDKLHELIHEVNLRRNEIRKIERGKIGNLNREFEKLRLKKKMLQKQGEQTGLIEKITARENKLQEQYEILATQARELRKRQSENILIYQAVTGEKKELAVGEIIHAYYPNQLNLFNRGKLFIYKIWTFLSATPREANTEGGVFPAIFGTFVMTIMMSIAVTPFGVLAAIYLREYAKQGFFVRAVRIAVNNLAGVPSIVFGVFGVGFFVYFVGGSIDHLFFSQSLPTPTFGTGGVLWASLTLALLTVPVVYCCNRRKPYLRFRVECAKGLLLAEHQNGKRFKILFYQQQHRGF